MPWHDILHIQGWYVCVLHHFKACYFSSLLSSKLNYNCYASPAKDMPMLVPGQGVHTHIYLSPPLLSPPNDMVCSITPKHKHVYKHNIYKLICLSAMNLKYLLGPSCIGCIPIHYHIQAKIVHANKTQTKKVHTTVKCAYVLEGEDSTWGTWCLYNIKVTRIQNVLLVSVCYWVFTVDYCLLFFVLFTSAE